MSKQIQELEKGYGGLLERWFGRGGHIGLTGRGEAWL